MNALALVDDCHDPRVIRAKASQSPSQGAWWVHRLPNHISRMVLSIVHDGGPKWMVGGTIFEKWLGAL